MTNHIKIPSQAYILLAFTIIALLPVLIFAAEDSADLYVKHDSWPETMVASRESLSGWFERQQQRLSSVKMSPWYSIGPIRVEGFTDVKFPEQGVDLQQKDITGKELWKQRPEYVDGKVHDLPDDNPASTYLYRTITVPQAMTLPAGLGSNDGIEFWLNGKKLLSHNIGRKAMPDQEMVSLTLEAGKNELLLKIYNQASASGFYFSLIPNPKFLLFDNFKKDFPTETAWFMQDLPNNRYLEWLDTDRDTTIEKKIIRAVLDEINPPDRPLEKRFELLTDENPSHKDTRWLILYVDAHKTHSKRMTLKQVNFKALRTAIEYLSKNFPAKYTNGAKFLEQQDKYEARLLEIQNHLASGSEQAQSAADSILNEVLSFQRKALVTENPLIDFDRLLFVKRPFLPDREKLGNHMCDQYFGFHATKQGGLFILENAFTDNPTARNVLADSVCSNGRFKGKKLPPGGFISPELSFDGKKILFAYTEAEPTRYEWTEKSTFHIFKVNVDGSGLEQLTDGVWNDFDPCWLPNGRIVFISERRGGYGRCHGRPVPTFTLHTMEPDGSDIVCISYHETNEWHPSIDNNGMIVYTRWDYVDRGFNQAHHPWITTPDGCDARAIHGNFAEKPSDRPLMELNVRAIPGSTKYVATAAPHHGQAYGSLVRIDPHVEDDNRMSPVTRLTPEQPFPEAEYGGYGGNQGSFGTAWPLDENFFLCVYDQYANPAKNPVDHSKVNYGIYLIDSFGNRNLIYRDPLVSSLDPIPLKPRTKPPVVPHVTSVGKAGGLSTAKEVEKFAPVGLINVYDSVKGWPENTKITALRIIQILPKTTPLADIPKIGYGDQKNARLVLGSVPVESDGSAYFNLPVGKPVFFQALDANGLAVQSMRSDTYVQPGQKLLCQGCHEPRYRIAQTTGRLAKAMQRKPSEIKPDVPASNPFSFPRLVQPVLDKNCVACHLKNPKAPDLRAGDWQKSERRWYTSYNNLRNYAFFFQNASWTTPITIPGKFGARASKLYQMLTKGHHNLKLSDEDMHRITLWLDCNSDFFGDYENIDAQAACKIVMPSLE